MGIVMMVGVVTAQGVAWADTDADDDQGQGQVGAAIATTNLTAGVVSPMADGEPATYTARVQFYDFDGTTPRKYDTQGGDSKLYVYAELIEADGDVIGWNVKEFDTSSEEDSHTVTFNKFQDPKENSQQVASDCNVKYNPSAGQTVRTRLYRTAPNYHLLHAELQSYETQPDDTLHGYKFIVNDTEEEANTSIIKIRRWNGSHLYINIDFDPGILTTITESDGYWLRAELTHTTGAPTYFVKKLTATGDPMTIEADVWREQQNGDIINNGAFTGNEPTVTVQILKALPDKVASESNAVKLDPNSFEVVASGGAVKGYKVDYPDGTLTIKDRKHDDMDTHKTTCSYNIKLTRQTLEKALAPEDILGESAEYGIVANRYKQHGHTETNFAVNYLDDNSNIDIDGSGDAPIPFVVGTIENNTKLWLSADTTVPANIFVGQESANAIKVTSPKLTTVYPRRVEDINSYVNGLIAAGKSMSTTMAGKTTLKPVFGGTGYVLDTTGFEDGKTIYVDADGILSSISTSGWKINKLPNQSIVFNIKAASSSGEGDSAILNLGEFTVDPNDGEGSVASTTSAKNGNPELNQRVDEVILGHITFNAVNAKKVHLQNTSALFLLPEAETVTQENGAGWILAKGTVDSKAEWHFYRHTRSYKAADGFVLKVGKNADYSWSGADTFSFTLTGRDNAPMPKASENGTATVQVTSSDREALFGKITYDAIGTYTYDVAEVIPNEAEATIEGSVYTYERATAADSGLTAGQVRSAAWKYNDVTYDASLHTLTVAVQLGDTTNGTSANGTSAPSLSVKEGDTVLSSGGSLVSNISSLTFNNQREGSVRTGSATLSVTKSLLNDTGRTFDEGFLFTLAKDADNEVKSDVLPSPAEINVQAGQTGSFGAIVYTEPGTYYYTITETAGSTPGMEYDTTAKWAKVVVSEPGEGDELQTTVTYGAAKESCVESSLTIVNKVKSQQPDEPTTFPVRISKVDVVDSAEVEGAHIQILDKDGTAVVAEWDSTTQAHEVQLKAGEYTLRETVAPNGYAITSDTHFTVSEEGKVTSSDTAISNDGVLLVEDARLTGKATLSVAKQVTSNVPTDGLDWLGTTSFNFALAAEGGTAVETKAAKAGETATFGELTFDKPGDYYYTITEAQPGNAVNNLTYDTAAKWAKVSVGVNAGNTALETSVTYGDSKDACDAADAATQLTVTNAYAVPALEKYVNKDVHQDLPAFDTPFTYDILAFIPKDAEKVVITDMLAKGSGISFLNGNDTEVVVEDIGPDNNHTAHGTVEQAKGTKVENAEVVIQGKELTVTVPDATANQGHWLRLTYRVKLDNAVVAGEGDYNESDENVVNNKTVISEKYQNGTEENPSHDGVATTASYVVYTAHDLQEGTEPTYSLEANDITVTPPTTNVPVSKVWLDADGNAEYWPEGVSVTVELLGNGKPLDEVTADIFGADKALERQTIVLTGDKQSGAFENVPVYDSIEYSVSETSVTGLPTGYTPSVSSAEDDQGVTSFVITNKQAANETSGTTEDKGAPATSANTNKATSKTTAKDTTTTTKSSSSTSPKTGDSLPILIVVAVVVVAATVAGIAFWQRKRRD